MYARSITFRARPGVTTQQASIIYHEMTKIVAGEDGYLGSTFMMNVETNHAISLTFWRDRDSGAAAVPFQKQEQASPIRKARSGEMQRGSLATQPGRQIKCADLSCSPSQPRTSPSRLPGSLPQSSERRFP